MHGDSTGVRNGLEHGLPNFPSPEKPHFPPKAKRFLRTAFGMGRRVTQGNPTSPMIFYIVVDVVVRAVLEVVCRPQEARHRMSLTVKERNLVFFADDKKRVGRDHILV